jgi:RecB family exonuclease
VERNPELGTNETKPGAQSPEPQAQSSKAKAESRAPTPRVTRLVRVPDLQAFHRSVVALATTGTPTDARDRIVVVPTNAAASLLVRTIEDAVLSVSSPALVLPDMVTPRELVLKLSERLGESPALLTPAEREVLLGVACRTAQQQGEEPPFQIRPGLIAEILRLYDDLKRRQNSVDDFERRALGILEPGAAFDRGAERLVRQTQFLAAAFRDFERRCAERGEDEHVLRAKLIAEASPRPCRHIVLTVGDEAVEPSGLAPADWDLLTRIPGLEKLDVVVTDTMLAGTLHERIHRMLPGIEEVREEIRIDRQLPVLVIPPGGGAVHVARDREEEVAGVARRVKQAVRHGALAAPGRAAVIVRQRLPYAYVAREVLRSAGVPCQMFDALPLAAEPFAAALDLVLSCVSADFARVPAIALLRSPHFRFMLMRDVADLDRALAEAGYLGSVESLERLLDVWRQHTPAGRPPSHDDSGGTSLPNGSGGAGKPDTAPGSHGARAIKAGELLLGLARELSSLRAAAPVAEHLHVLRAFMLAHESPIVPDELLRARHLRARGAVLGTLAALRDAYARFDSQPVSGDEVAALLRRWIEGQTFAPRTGDDGVHLVDADSARLGRFEYVHIAGLVEDEWPDRARRNIFYSPAVLRELGWPAESDRLAGARAAFADLLRLPTSRLSASTFLLEADALVTPSPLVDEVEQSGLDSIEEAAPSHRIFHDEALYHDPVDRAPLSAFAREWLDRRVRLAGRPLRPFRGFTDAPAARPYSLSALERYQDCPFKFFAADVLRLEETPEDESTMSPRARGRFIHEVFQRFFEAWDRRGGGAITADRLDEARALMTEVAEPLLARLPEADAALERTQLFGSAISTGSVEIVLGHEAAAPADVEERWLEYRLEGEFVLGAPGGRMVALKGVADRIDLLPDNRLRVIDYKSGSAPNTSRALQVAIYALCAQERLRERDGGTWTVDEAIYLAFRGKRSLAPVVRAGDAESRQALEGARTRLLHIVDRIGRGEFPPQPHDEILCDFCAYAAVCRKDYVHD